MKSTYDNTCPHCSRQIALAFLQAAMGGGDSRVGELQCNHCSTRLIVTHAGEAYRLQHDHRFLPPDPDRPVTVVP